MKVVLEHNITLESKYLNKDVEKHILNKLKNVMKNKSSLELGYIIDVIKIIKLGDNKISSVNSLAVFNVTFEAETLKPVDGLEVEGHACMLSSDGIFVDVLGKLNIIIPAGDIEDFSYDLMKSVVTCNKMYKKTSIEKGEKMRVEIIVTKYEDKKFKCIGKLKEILKAKKLNK